MGYHEQPHTLDPNVKLDPKAPLAQGHSEDDRDDVASATEDLRKQVEAEAGQDPVGPRAPGDHAQAKKSKKSDD